LRIHIRNELLAINLWSAFLVLVIAFADVQPLRLILAFPFLLFSPGYSFLAALFPEKSRFGTFERIALSISLSVGLVPLMGLLLNYVWEIQLYPIVTSLAGFVAATSIIGWYRKRRLPAAERMEIHLHISLPKRAGASEIDRALTILLIVVVLAAIGVFSYLLVRPKVGERFTEFYILGAEGTAAGYPTELTVGKEASVTLGIINREQETMSYQIRWTIPGQLDEMIGPFTLAAGEKREEQVSFTLRDPTGDTVLVEEINPQSKDNGPPGMAQTIRVASTEHLSAGDVIWVGNEVDRVRAVEGDTITLEEGLTRYHPAETEVRESQKVAFHLYKVRELRGSGGRAASLALWVGKEHLHAIVTNQGLTEANYAIGVKLTDQTIENGKQVTTQKAVLPEPVPSGKSWAQALDYPLSQSYTREMEITLEENGKLLYREKTPNAYPAVHFWISVRQE